MVAGCSSARSTRRSRLQAASRGAIRAEAARPARMPARRRPFPRRTGSMRGAASRTSRSNIMARSPSTSGAASATASMAATTVSPPARGTSSPTPRTRTARSCRVPSLSRHRWPTCSRSTMRGSGRCLRDRRSKGSGADAWYAMPRLRQGTAAIRGSCRRCGDWPTTRSPMVADAALWALAELAP